MATKSTIFPADTTPPLNAQCVHFVPLERLPDAVQFPDTFADRIWFDSVRNRLAFRGFMSKATFDRLDALSSENAYQRAIEELFRKSVYDEPVSRRGPVRKLLPIAALLVTVSLLATALSLPLRLLAER